MKSVFHVIKRAFSHEPELHPVDRSLAKRWIKQRLGAVFPQLRKNPAELERAYQALSLEPRPGRHEGEADTVFEAVLPEGHELEQQ
jgi:hypothetical protein